MNKKRILFAFVGGFIGFLIGQILFPIFWVNPPSPNELLVFIYNIVFVVIPTGGGAIIAYILSGDV